MANSCHTDQIGKSNFFRGVIILLFVVVEYFDFQELLFKTHGCKKSYLSELSSSFLQGIGARVSATCTKQITIPKNLVINNLNYCGIISEHFILKVFQAVYYCDIEIK